MSLKIYNTLKGKKEEFVPVNPGKVGMYVCGPTVYDTSHIGHARSVVVFDMIFRWLKQLDYEVTYVRNFTDVDDKIIKKSNETGESCTAITEKYIGEFHNEMDALNVLRPTMAPKATEHIDHIIRFVQMLIDKGKAYHVEGGMSIFPSNPLRRTASCRVGTPMTCRPGPGSPWTRKNAAPWISPCGSRPNPGSPPGTAPGARGGPAGTLSARP